MSELLCDEERLAGRDIPTAECEEIEYPGTYVVHGAGALMRVPAQGACEGQMRTVISPVAKGVPASRISPDPWIPLSRARGLAADHDLPVDF